MATRWPLVAWAALDGAVQRRPSHRRSPHGHPLPRARCHPRRELLGAERALCRRRARTAAPSRTGAITPSPTKVSSGTAPVNLPDAAWPLKLPSQPLPRRNRSPELPRSRPPPRIAYKRRPRARTRTHTTSALHQYHAKPLEEPRGSLLPQLRPPRPATGSSLIRSRACTSTPQLLPVAF